MFWDIEGYRDKLYLREVSLVGRGRGFGTLARHGTKLL